MGRVFVLFKSVIKVKKETKTMDYSLKEVAGRIKDLREAKGFTPAELAKLTGVSLEDYLVLERGETDFSFTFIYKCAKACDVEVVDLLEGRSSTLTSFAITRRGEVLRYLNSTATSTITSRPNSKRSSQSPSL